MIVFLWQQLPIYAARCIGRFVESTNEEVVVVRIASNRFAIKGAEVQTHCRVIDAASDESRSLQSVVGAKPNILVVGGWASSCFVRWTKEAKKNGARVILATDEAYVDRGLRQFLRKMRFKIFLDRLYDRIFYCGKGGYRQFHDYYGLPDQKLFGGVYGSDPALFPCGKPLAERPKRFLFVGHFDANKNVLMMCRAFQRVHERHPEWELELCGSGPLEKEIPKTDGILLTGFVQAEDLGEKYRQARCLVLGSFSEKWGVVVHEAAASGCLLLMSSHVGSNPDFVRPENAETFAPEREDDCVAGMERIIMKTDAEIQEGQRVSVELAKGFSPDVFARNLAQAICELRTES